MKTLKPILLLIAIVAGAILQNSAASARDIQTAVFAGGCFWCVESDFDHVKGVIETTSGYTGGTTKNPTYKQVTKGGTGHYESVRIKFDADVVTYRELADIFWRTIDVFDAGGQFCDRGDSYRAAVFTNGDAQKANVTASKAAAEGVLGRKFATKIVNATTFYPAEGYHQNYYLGTNRVLTRFGYVKQADAYKSYRKGCGRDARVKAIWGKSAPFAGS
jgi:peptide-methionine (S)-S-oxide reductase